MTYSLSVTDVEVDDLHDAVAEVVSANEYGGDVEAQIQKSVDIAESMAAYLELDRVNLALSGHVKQGDTDVPYIGINVGAPS